MHSDYGTFMQRFVPYEDRNSDKFSILQFPLKGKKQSDEFIIH
jgi:hypothetical protein